MHRRWGWRRGGWRRWVSAAVVLSAAPFYHHSRPTYSFAGAAESTVRYPSHYSIHYRSQFDHRSATGEYTLPPTSRLFQPGTCTSDPMVIPIGNCPLSESLEPHPTPTPSTGLFRLLTHKIPQHSVRLDPCASTYRILVPTRPPSPPATLTHPHPPIHPRVRYFRRRLS